MQGVDTYLLDCRVYGSGLYYPAAAVATPVPAIAVVIVRPFFTISAHCKWHNYTSEAETVVPSRYRITAPPPTIYTYPYYTRVSY